MCQYDKIQKDNILKTVPGPLTSGSHTFRYLLLGQMPLVLFYFGHIPREKCPESECPKILKTTPNNLAKSIWKINGDNIETKISES